MDGEPIIRVLLIGGPCDGAETVLKDPLPATIQGKGPDEDLYAEMTGERDQLKAGESTYHLVKRTGDLAYYVAARFVRRSSAA